LRARRRVRPDFGRRVAHDYGLFWARWYAANALGSLTLGPIAMICMERTTRPTLAPAWRAVEAVIIAAFLVAACIIAFEDLPSIASGYLPLLFYLPLPIIVWAAVRFGAKGASGAIFVISIVLIWRTLNGPSLFDIGSPEANVFGMQLFLIGLSPPICCLVPPSKKRAGPNGARGRAKSEYHLRRRRRT
jgi:integral membrane sensor domain MASE1